MGPLDWRAAPSSTRNPRQGPHLHRAARQLRLWGGTEPGRRCRAGERLQRREPGQKTKRDANADSARDYRPRAAIHRRTPPGNVHPEGPCQGVARLKVQLDNYTTCTRVQTVGGRDDRLGEASWCYNFSSLARGPKLGQGPILVTHWRSIGACIGASIDVCLVFT